MGPAFSPIIELPSEATATWFTQMFQSHGRDLEVSNVTSGPIGTGQSGHNERFELTYAGEMGPASIVAKLPAQNELSRAAGASGGYLAETRFYEHVADTVAIRTPACIHAAAAEDSSSFTLLLEDMAPAVQGDQIQGCSLDEVISAIVGVAGLHGPRWNDASLRDFDWLSSPDDVERSAFVAEIVHTFVPGFIQRYSSHLGDRQLEVIRRFDAGVEQWLRREGPGFGLVHADYRPDNLLFAPGLESPTTAVDWQTVTTGHVLSDVAYLLGNALDPAVRAANEQEIVHRYHNEMIGHGVQDLSNDDCFESYRAATFHGPLITILGSMMVIQTDRGDEMFMVMIDRSVQQILDLDALEFLT